MIRGGERKKLIVSVLSSAPRRTVPHVDDALIDVLIVDDLALRPMDGHETADLYALVCGRHRVGSMIVTSNRDPSEWLGLLADPLQAQALVDRFVNNAHDLVIEGESYRRRQKPARARS